MLCKIFHTSVLYNKFINNSNSSNHNCYGFSYVNGFDFPFEVVTFNNIKKH